jgi:hypothetical protein
MYRFANFNVASKKQLFHDGGRHYLSILGGCPIRSRAGESLLGSSDAKAISAKEPPSRRPHLVSPTWSETRK